MADDDSPTSPPAPDYHETPYVMQHPDGSTETRVLRTDRPITHGELSDYVGSRGAVYMGPPPPPTTTTTTTTVPPTTTTQWQPPPPLGPDATDADRARRAWTLGMGPPEAPLDSATTTTATTPAPAAPAAQPPSLMQAFGGYDLGSGSALSQAFAPPSPGLPEAPPGYERVAGALLPHRTLSSQVPSIIGATIGGRTGSYAGTELLGPEAGLVTGTLGAGLGGGIGEGGRILYEKATGAEPAEPGGAWPRIENAAVRSALTEGATYPLRALPMSVARRVNTAADAMQELEPVLTGKVAGPLTDWWAEWSQKPAADMAKAWFKQTAEEQAQLAGGQLAPMQDLMTTIGRAGGGLTKGQVTSYLSGGLGPAAASFGFPHVGLGAAYVPARALVSQISPAVMSSIARGAPASPWLLQLPRAAQVAGRMISPVVRGAAQTYSAENAPSAEEAFGKRYTP